MRKITHFFSASGAGLLYNLLGAYPLIFWLLALLTLLAALAVLRVNRQSSVS